MPHPFIFVYSSKGSKWPIHKTINIYIYIYILCWDICIRWHMKLKMLTTKCGLPTLKFFFIDIMVDERLKGLHF